MSEAATHRGTIDSEPAGLGGRLAKWAQRFGAARDEDDDDAGEQAAPAPAPRRGDNRRRRLFDDIGDFIFNHNLDVTPLNFGLAYDFITGNDHAVEKAVAAVLRERGQLNNGAAEAILAQRGADALSPEALGSMLDMVEENLGHLTRLVDVSRSSAKDYGTALQEQVRDLDAAGTGAREPVLATLVTLTRTMVEKTREVEAQMRESQKNTRLLQKNLETARLAAEQDHLTGLPNRRAFESTLKGLAATALTDTTPLALAFCDIDHFKVINDTHGHDTGDRVLKFVGDLLRKISNDTCHVARHGGEEFVMLFPGRTAAEASVIVDAARDDLSTRSLVNRATGQRMERVTFSAGIANVLDYEDPRTALRAADNALYLAKEHGRNRVYLAADA